MTLPPAVRYGTVTATFPDPPAGLQVRFRPDLRQPIARLTTASPPLTFSIDEITATIDGSGRLLDPAGTPGVQLLADPDLEPSAWTWRVRISSNTTAPVEFSIAVTADTTVDLSSVVPVPPDLGAALTEWLQAVTAAQAARDAAVAAAAGVAAGSAAAISTALASLVGSAPDALNTLQEIDAAIAADEGSAAALAALVALKAPLASPALTGTPTAPTVADATDSSTKVATTAFVQDASTALAGSVSATYVSFSATAPDHTIAPVWVDTSAVPQVVKGWNGTAWVAIGGGTGGGAVSSVAGRTGAVTLAKSDVGLSSVDNTSDASKPISTAQAAVNAAKADLVGGVVPTAQIPALALTSTFPVASQTAMLALTTSQVQPGDIAVITADPGKGSYILVGSDPSQLANWILLNAPTDVVTTVNGQAGTVVLAKADVGLGNVDNTSDASKPISTAQAAVNAQAAGATGYTGNFRSAWAGGTAYAIGDVVTTENGLYRCITAHTSNGAGFRFDRANWSYVPMPALGSGTTVQVRQLDTTNIGAGLTAPLTAGVFQRRPKQFDYSAEKLLASFQAASDVTITGGSTPTAATGTQVGGSVVLTSGTNTTEAWFRVAPFAAAIDLSNAQIRLPVKISAIANNVVIVDLTSAAGGTDFTNYTRLTLLTGNTDGGRIGYWRMLSAATTEAVPSGTGATMTAITGARVTLYRGTAQYTCEVSRLTYLVNPAPIAKCILWLDDGTFTSHQTAIKTAAKYNLPVTLAPIAANLVNATGGLTADMARYTQDFLRGQVAMHAFGEIDHNTVQSGTTLFEQLLDYQHFALAAGLHGDQDLAYWSTGFVGPNTQEMDATVKKMVRSARGGVSRLVETLPPGDPWTTRAMMTGGADTSVGTWQPYATRAINAKGLAQFVWHDMTGSIPTEFATFCAWLDANRATIQTTTPNGAFDPLCN